MQRHWRTVAPPLNVMLAAFVGFRPKKPSSSGSQEEDPAAFDIDAFLRIAQAFK
jgi:hypothetical protein